MSEFPLDSDLLQATLTEDDDKGDFDRPWNPETLVYLSFFFGLLAGGMLLALNYRRLGMKRRLAPAVILVVNCGPLGQVWITLLRAENAVPVDYRWALPIGLRILAVVVSVFFAWDQRRRYRLSTQTETAHGSLLVPAIVASIVSVSASFLVPYITLWFL